VLKVANLTGSVAGIILMQFIEFGPFEFRPAERLLLKGQARVEIGSRALDILALLIENAGNVVGKEVLLAQVWPGVVVEESSIRVHIANLRRALGDGKDGARYVTNVPGRGYSFVGKIAVRSDVAVPPPSPEVPASSEIKGFPARPARIIGRDVEVKFVTDLLGAQRFVTIHGPGGIGKTTLALAVMHDCAGNFPDGVCFLDLGLGRPSDSIAETLEAALVPMSEAVDPATRILDHLRNRRMLLVLDCCEHVVESASMMLERIFREASGISILATSRESLNVDGECIYRLASLGVPPDDESLDVSQILAYPAAKLFYDRAVAGGLHATLSAENARAIASIARKVDGIALALELTAGRIGSYGLPEIAKLIDTRMGLLWQGRRNALPRHRTMTATLDWSYELTSEPERTVLARLSRILGSFSLREAQALASDNNGIDEADVAQIVDQLVSKSLLSARVDATASSYRILDMPRAYIQAKLLLGDELPEVSRKHALFCQDRLKSYRQSDGKIAAQLAAVDAANLRIALEWAFSAAGDRKIAVALTVAAVPMWAGSSNVGEAQEWIRKAILALPSDVEPQLEMELHAALGSTLIFTNGASSEVETTWTKVLQLAEGLGATDQKLSALWGLLSHRINNRDFRGCLPLAIKFRETASESSDTSNIYIGDRLIGRTMFFLGDFADAQRHLESAVTHYDPVDRQRHIARYQFDQTVRATSSLAEIYWLQGASDRAMQLAVENVRDAEAIGHELSVCTALGQSACPISIQMGDLSAARKWINQLSEIALRRGLLRWHAWARCYDGMIERQNGTPTKALQILRSVLTEFPDTTFRARHNTFVGALALAAASAGEHSFALKTIGDAIDRSDRMEERWSVAELLRIKGEVLLKGRTGHPDAEQLFRKSLEWAVYQGAKAWELRTAVSLAKLLRDTKRGKEARVLLSKPLAQLNQEYQTLDILAAKTLLNELA
jgi:predicted ATPase/DNA-binding winged helix-turn-helix (wHTH) protein